MTAIEKSQKRLEAASIQVGFGSWCMAIAIAISVSAIWLTGFSCWCVCVGSASLFIYGKSTRSRGLRNRSLEPTILRFEQMVESRQR